MTDTYYATVTRHDDYTEVVLGGHVETAESAETKDHAGRMAALFAHQAV